MTYYFISFEDSKFSGFLERFPALEDGIWIEKQDDLQSILQSGMADLCFFVEFSRNPELESWITLIREAAPKAKIIFVTADLKPGELKTHQQSPAGGDAYVSRQVSADTLERILSGFQNDLTNVRGNKLETEESQQVSQHFELSSLIELKRNSLSQELDSLFEEAIPQTTQRPKFQSLADLAPSEDEGEAGVNIMSDQDKELSLSNLGDLELSETSDLPPETPADEDGLELSLGEGMDLNLADGEVPAMGEEMHAQMDAPGELDLGAADDLSLTETEPHMEDDSLSLSDTPTSEEENVSLSEAPVMETQDEASGLILSDGTSTGMDFSLEGELSPDAKEKLAEIDAIMEEDSKVMSFNGDDMSLLEEAADLMTGTGNPAPLEAEAEGDSLDLGGIDDSLAESSGEADLNLDLSGEGESEVGEEVSTFSIADIPSAAGLEPLDSDLDQPLVSEDLDLANLDFGSESSEETVVAVRKPKAPVEPEPVEEELELAPQEEEKTQTKIRRKKKDKEKEEREAPVMHAEKPMGEELREISGAYSAELERLQATLSNLRGDREELLKKIQTLEEEKLLHNRQTLSLRAELDEKKIELSIVRKKLNEDIGELKDKLRLEEERRLILEERNRVLREELEKSSQKSKIDVKKVQLRERELEQKLELLKADAETQIRNRDLKILELKRKIDAMEFDMESMQVQEKRTVESRFELEDKLEKAIKTLRSAISVLEDETDKGAALEALKKNIEM